MSFPVDAGSKTSVTSGSGWVGVQITATAAQREDVRKTLGGEEKEDGKTERGSWREQRKKERKEGKEGEEREGRNGGETEMEGWCERARGGSQSC